MTATRTVWEQTGQKPKTRFGDIIPCEAMKHRFTGVPVVDCYESDTDCTIHLRAACSVRLARVYREAGWKRISTWKQLT